MRQRRRKSLILRLYERDRGICWICQQTVPHPHADCAVSEMATKDHIRPVSRGGRATMRNLRLAHYRCNHWRGNRHENFVHEEQSMPEYKFVNEPHAARDEARTPLSDPRFCVHFIRQNSKESAAIGFTEEWFDSLSSADWPDDVFVRDAPIEEFLAVLEAEWGYPPTDYDLAFMAKTKGRGVCWRNVFGRAAVTRDELSAAGEALYGPRWQTDLAKDLGLNDAVRIRQWLSGARPIPVGVRAELVELLRRRADEANTLADKLAKAV